MGTEDMYDMVVSNGHWINAIIVSIFHIFNKQHNIVQYHFLQVTLVVYFFGTLSLIFREEIKKCCKCCKVCLDTVETVGKYQADKAAAAAANSDGK